MANEELVLTHEELQATIEEYETTNEELQATNEELETNNEELQATNEELETTNEELRARTAELQDLNTFIQNERVRLMEIVELAPLDITVLRGHNLIVEAFNPRNARQPEGREVLDRPLDEVYEFLWEGGAEIVRLAHEAYQRDTTYTTPTMRDHLPQEQSNTAASYFVYTIVPSHDAKGKVSGVIIYANDQTQLRAKEAEEERKRLKMIFDNADLMTMALYDAQTSELLIASPRHLDIVSRIHNLDRDKLIGRKWLELTLIKAIASDEEAAELWNKVLESRTSINLPEVHLKFPTDEHETVWYYKLIPIIDEERENNNFVLVVAFEITEQIKARQDVERLNKLKDEFLSLASHELRTPLTSILGNAQLAQRDLKRQEAIVSTETQGHGIQQVEKNLGRIIYQIKRMGRLIDEMLDIARLRGEIFELKAIEDVNLVELAQRVVEQMKATTDRSIVLDANEDAIRGTFDADRIEQVLNNLINNAVKYSLADKPVMVGVERQSDEAIIWVRDQGPGISKEEQELIFERFYRARSENAYKTEGLGLGLYISHEIVTRHGGRMWLESQPGEGSTFYFSLPIENHV